MDHFQELLSPEVPRNRERWYSSYDYWVWNIDYMRKFITKTDHLGQMVNNLKKYIGLTQEEIDTYFWRWKWCPANNGRMLQTKIRTTGLVLVPVVFLIQENQLGFSPTGFMLIDYFFILTFLTLLYAPYTLDFFFPL